MAEMDTHGMLYCALMLMDGVCIEGLTHQHGVCKPTNTYKLPCIIGASLGHIVTFVQVEMLCKAASANLAEACSILGLSLLHGLRNMEIDKERGLKYLKMAASAGNKVAQMQLSYLGVNYVHV